jgi:RNA polymerase sigma-70 factor (ECF subfamily)
MLVADEVPGGSSPDMERREAAKHLMRLINGLPPANRIVLLLHDVEGYTAEEIRMVVGVRSVSTVKSRLRLARAELHRKARVVPALRWIYGGSREKGES